MPTPTRDWDESKPADEEIVADGAKAIRYLKQDFRERVNNYCPIGIIMHWPTETCPTGWMECDGSSLLITDYPDLYAITGDTFGAADPTHFNIPDLRGIFPRAWDHGAGRDLASATRTGGDTVGSTQDDENKTHSHRYKYGLGNAVANQTHTATGTTGSSGVEFRPKNVNGMYIIRTDPL